MWVLKRGWRGGGLSLTWVEVHTYKEIIHTSHAFSLAHFNCLSMKLKHERLLV